jgi:teichuronic acid exporter
MLHEQQYRSGVRWSFVGTGAVAVLQLVQLAVFARIAGPQAAGEFALVAALVSMGLPLAEAGIGQAVVQADGLRRDHLFSLLVLSSAWSALLYLLLWWLSPWCLSLFERSDLAGQARLLGTTWLFAPLQVLCTGVLQRAFRFDVLARTEAVSWLCAVGLVICLALDGWGSWAMAVGFSVRQAIATLGMVWALGTTYAGSFVRFSKWKDLQSMFHFGWIETMMRLADQWSNNLDKAIVGRFLGAEALGMYNLGYTFLAMPTGRLGYMVSRVTFPVFARLRDDRGGLNAFFGEATLDIVHLLFPLYALAFAFAPEIIQTVFGDVWMESVPIVRIFCVLGFVRTVGVPIPQLLRGLGKPQWALYWLLGMTAASNMALWFFLSAKPTGMAAAWSQFLVQGLLGFWGYRWLTSWCGVDATDAWMASLKIGLMVLVPLFLCLGFEWWHIPWAWMYKTGIFGLFLAWFGLAGPARVHLKKFL